MNITSKISINSDVKFQVFESVKGFCTIRPGFPTAQFFPNGQELQLAEYKGKLKTQITPQNFNSTSIIVGAIEKTSTSPFSNLQLSLQPKPRRSEAGQNQPPNFHKMQNPGNSYGMNQQGSCGQNHFGQPMQQDPFIYNQQQQNQQQNPCASNLQSVPGNPCLCTPGMSQSQMIPCSNFLPQNILDQIRTCVGSTSPIFILPNSPPIQTQQLPQVQQNPAPQMPINIGYPHVGYPPSIGTGYPPLGSNPIFSPACYPVPVPLPFYNPFGNQNRSQSEKISTGCDCCRKNNANSNSATIRNSGISSSSWEENETHRCCAGSDDTVCTKSNCPASINLQALASQLLSLQGVIPCAATRLVMRKVPGSNVTTTIDETMERAQKSIGSLNREQLITEARNAQQVNGLINLHMIANPPRNIIPILTMVQLKVNSLKALVENLVNKSVSECQNIGTQGNTSLEPMVLAIKTDADIRELLATLRQKECEERVNVNYAPYHSQRVVAESRLANFQNKISQVEAEMERRRAVGMPWVNSAGQFHQAFFTGVGNCRPTIQETQCNGVQGFNSLFNASQIKDDGGKGFESPSPFMVQVQSPRRLNLKPNVGGPETTYHQSSEEQNLASPEAFAVSKLDKETADCCENSKSCNDQDQENLEPSRQASNLGQGGTEGKKKLKIHIDKRGELSVKKQSLEELDVGEFVQLSPEVVIVIDKDLQGSKDKAKSQTRLKKRNKKKSVKKKSAESIPSDSTYDSEASVSSRSSGAEKKDEEQRVRNVTGKSFLKNVSKGKKKTPKIENDHNENMSHEIPEANDEVGPLSTKKEKHVNVAMLSEILNDQFILRDKIYSLGPEGISFLQNHPGSETRLESSTQWIEQNEDYDPDKLDIIEENARDLAVKDNPESFHIQKSCTGSNEIFSILRDLSNNSIISSASKLRTKKSPSVLGQSQANTFQQNSSLRKLEAQNQTVDDYIHPSIVRAKKMLKENTFRDNKENMSENPRTCSIIRKKNRDSQSLEGSVSSYIGRDQRKKHIYRFK